MNEFDIDVIELSDNSILNLFLKCIDTWLLFDTWLFRNNSKNPSFLLCLCILLDEFSVLESCKALMSQVYHFVLK